MIRSFKNRALKRFADRGDSRRLSVQNTDRVRRILAMLDKAKNPRDMDLPGFKFHHNKHWGHYAVWVSGNWRITFEWRDGAAENVNLVDYH